jgi:hypothetical protein
MDRLHPFLYLQKGRTTMANEKTNEPKESEALLIDEFEIIELENRLELADRCNGRCDKKPVAT